MSTEREISELQVGIASAKEISFTLTGMFISDPGVHNLTGNYRVTHHSRRIVLYQGGRELIRHDQISLKSLDPGASFILHNVVIGIGFHWQRTEDQVFSGSLKFIIEEDKVTAVNLVHIEEYLKSVISSEMKATASEELLKAHAVISRGWLLAQIEKNRDQESDGTKSRAQFISDKEIIRWYDREDHMNFDVCADDHCQRYQGITRAASPVVAKAVEETCGEVLTYDGRICDTRYYKCCGGVTELFENIWGSVNHPYLQRVFDNTVPPAGYGTEFDRDENIRKWISGNPDAFCNTSDKRILSQVLNDYDLETVDFYRWKVTYTQNELSEIIRNRTGIDFGTVTDLIPLERGTSGRIIRLRIEGTLKTIVIGKELEIRKSLSKTHLYSSCFYVEKTDDRSGIRFILHGAGWGHGVGLCQIGAAVMGSKGYKYDEILAHYFIGARLEKRF